MGLASAVGLATMGRVDMVTLVVAEVSVALNCAEMRRLVLVERGS